MSRNPITSNDSAAPLVRFDGVEARPARPDERPEAVSFTIEPRSFQFLAGPAGSGKSVILGLIGLDAAPARGRVDLFGRDLARLRRQDRPLMRRRIGRLFQGLDLVDEMSVFDNVALAARATERRARDYGPKLVELLTWLGLARRADVPAASLPPPERHRVALARALINAPDLILADEPAAGLDAAEGVEILRLIAQVHRAGAAVLIATRDVAMASRSGAPLIRLTANGGRAPDLAPADRAA